MKFKFKVVKTFEKEFEVESDSFLDARDVVYSKVPDLDMKDCKEQDWEVYSNDQGYYCGD